MSVSISICVVIAPAVFVLLSPSLPLVIALLVFNIVFGIRKHPPVASPVVVTLGVVFFTITVCGIAKHGQKVLVPPVASPVAVTLGVVFFTIIVCGIAQDREGQGCRDQSTDLPNSVV
jgi:hypothetical protein